MQEQKIASLFQILNGDVIDVCCNNIDSKLYFDGDCFICDCSSYCSMDIQRKHVDISIQKEEEKFYGLDALNLRYPQPKYNFPVLSTVDRNEKFKSGVLLLSKEIPDDIVKFLNNIDLNDIKYCEYDNLRIRSEILYINSEKYAQFTLDKQLPVDHFVGILLRIAHSLCFLFRKFSAAKIVLLYSETGYALSSSGDFNLNRPYTIFDLPQLYGYYNYKNFNPQITKEFSCNFVRLTLKNDYIFNIICMTLECAKYNALIMPISMYAALEMFANENSSTSNISLDWKNKIKSIVKEFKKTIKENSAIPPELAYFIDKKLDGFFQPLNSDRLKKACQNVKLIIDNDDADIFKQRNDFLHGRLRTFEDSNSYFQSILHPHRIVCSLLAKKGGYEGYIFQYDKFLPNQQDSLSIETVFRKI